MAAAPPSASTLPSESLQLLILEQLDAPGQDGQIPDSRTLTLPNGSALGGEASEQRAIKAALDSLARRDMVTSDQKQIESLALTSEGEQMAKDGSHEFRIWSAVGADADSPVGMKELQEKLGAEVAKVGQLKAFKNKWIKKQGDGFVRAVRLSPSPTYYLGWVA